MLLPIQNCVQKRESESRLFIWTEAWKVNWPAIQSQRTGNHFSSVDAQSLKTMRIATALHTDEACNLSLGFYHIEMFSDFCHWHSFKDISLNVFFLVEYENETPNTTLCYLSLKSFSVSKISLCGCLNEINFVCSTTWIINSNIQCCNDAWVVLPTRIPSLPFECM